MMAMIFIDDPYYPYKTCFLLATVLSNTPSPLFFFLTYSHPQQLLTADGFRHFTCLAALKKKITQVKTER